MRLYGQRRKGNTKDEVLVLVPSANNDTEAFIAIRGSEDACGIWLTRRQTEALRDRLTAIIETGSDDGDADRPEIEYEEGEG